MIVAKTGNKRTIGPRQHGRRMSLRAFEFAQVEEGYLYELARGYIVVSDVPNFSQMRQAALIRKRLDRYDGDNPGIVYEILVSTESKLVIPAWESERHADITVYLTPSKGRKDRPEPALCTRMPVASGGARDRDRLQRFVTNFFLDCFEKEDLTAVLKRVSEACSSAAISIDRDFRLPVGGWPRLAARFVLAAMYLFFRLAARLPARWLVDPAPYLESHGFVLAEGKSWLRGGLTSRVWVRGIG